MANTIKKLTIEGFKSIRKLEDFPLHSLNVLIGANGAGKSNFVGFFRLLRDMIEQRLQVTLATTEGGADGCLYLGPKITDKLVGKFSFARNGYEFTLLPTSDNRLVFSDEATVFFGDLVKDRSPLGSGHFEANLKDHKDDPGKGGASRGIPSYVYEAISNWVVYHFHDTSLNAAVRRPRALNDNVAFRSTADNLAPFLYRIQQTSPASYTRIRDVVRLAAPFFDDFKLRPMPTSPDMMQLEWQQAGSDYPFRAHQLSDGTLRFICMATALLQPNRPPTVLFDEPELGLHPLATSMWSSSSGYHGRRAANSESVVRLLTTEPSRESQLPDLTKVARTGGRLKAFTERAGFLNLIANAQTTELNYEGNVHASGIMLGVC
jgi:predicted ATPase